MIALQSDDLLARGQVFLLEADDVTLFLLLLAEALVLLLQI